MTLQQTEPPQFDLVRQFALSLPGVEEGTSYGTPAFKVRGKLLARLHPDGQSLVLRIDMTERQLLMQMEPDIYFITDHYLDYPWVLVRLSRVHPDSLRKLFRAAWRNQAPKALVTAFDKDS